MTHRLRSILSIKHDPRLIQWTLTIAPGIIACLIAVHATSRKASRLTFNNQSIRQLLEQLEANQYELRRKARRGGIIIRTKPVQEILETDWIDMFPETWRQEDGRSSATGADPSSSSSSARTPATKQQKYADLRSRIITLQKKYQSLKDRHQHYKVTHLPIWIALFQPTLLVLCLAKWKNPVWIDTFRRCNWK